jgi:hypothetical protein
MSPIYVPGKVVLKKDGVAATDTNIREVSLLLHGNGTNGSTTITDSSLTPKTVTAFGNAQISTAQSKFGGASIAFDGDGDYLTTPDTGGFRFGIGDYTVEAWIYQTARSSFAGGITGNGFYDGTKDNGWNLDVNSSGVLRFYSSATGLATELVTSGATLISLNTWTHVAAARSGNTLSLYINGTSRGSVTSANNENWSGANAQLKVGTLQTNVAIGTTATSFNGYIDDLRITKGVARYTANFTPPTLPFPDF